MHLWILVSGEFCPDHGPLCNVFLCFFYYAHSQTMVIIASSRLWPHCTEVKKEVCPGIPQWEAVGSNAREAAVPALVAVLRLRDTCNMQDCCWFVDRTSTLHERAIHVCIARCECAAVCDPPND